MDLSVADLQKIVGGRLRLGEMPPRAGELTAVGTLVTDSRRVNPGDVFWGLKGTRHDGSHFAEEALARGASGVVNAGRWVAPWAGTWSLMVDDAAVALWRLADWNTQRFAGRMVTVEGAVGKTTAASMIDAVLKMRLIGQLVTGEESDPSPHATAHALAGSATHNDYAVVELHEDLHERVAGVARLTRPDFAVFTHSGEHGMTRSSITVADAEWVQRLRSVLQNGIPSIVNGDDARLRKVAGEAQNAIFVGRGSDNHISAVDVESAGGLLRFKVGRSAFTVRLRGRHHLTSALAAVAVGRLFGLSYSDISEGLASYQPLEPCCAIRSAGQSTIIGDTVHNEPAALQAAMELLAESDQPGRRVMFCGDLDHFDQGSPSPRTLGEQAVTRAGADLLVACGPHAAAVIAGATEAGLPLSRAVTFETADTAWAQFVSQLQPGDAVLLSGRNLSTVLESIQQPRAMQRHAA